MTLLAEDVLPDLKEKLIDEIESALVGELSMDIKDIKPLVKWSCSGDSKVQADLYIGYEISIGSSSHTISELVVGCPCASRQMSSVCCKGSCNSKD